MKDKAKKEKKALPVVVGGLLFLTLITILGLNLYFSQLIPDLYFRLIKNDRKAAVSFLSQIRRLSAFPDIFSSNKKIYGAAIEDEVFAEDNKRAEKISMFENLLRRNPNSRDILYNLYILYKQDGKPAKALEYLFKAKKLDPMLK